MNFEINTDIDVEVTLKCSKCGEELTGIFDRGLWGNDRTIEIKPHYCPGNAGFYTAAVEHEFRKKFGDEAADWLELQKMLFERD